VVNKRNELVSLGLEAVFSPPHYRASNSDKEAMKNIANELLDNHPSIFEGRIEKMALVAQLKIVRAIAEHSFYILDSEYWIKFLEGKIKAVSSNSLRPYDIVHHGHGTIAVEAADFLHELTGTIDWFELYKKFEPAIAACSNSSDAFEKLVKLTIKNDTDRLLEHVRKVDFKKRHRAVRRGTYIGLIRGGYLDEKLARRIRSDTSEYVSSACIAVLFEELENYEQPDELIAQFLDTRYDAVGIKLIQKSPDKYLPFLVGVKSSHAKKLLEKRMDAAAAAKKNP